uniref:Uncharacterized protein n=1 Tax=Paramormyrops kingsleyae TaxID=1676925 RepID=A0A3B3S1R1_9TELE
IVEMWHHIVSSLYLPGEEEERKYPWRKKKKKMQQQHLTVIDCIWEAFVSGTLMHLLEGNKITSKAHISVEELDELLQAPEATLQALVVQVLQQNPDHLDDGQDQGTEGKRASVVPEGCSAQGCEYGECRHVIRLLEGPIVGGKGTSQGHLTQCRHEVGTPEEEEEVVELKHDQIFVVRTLAPVKGKQALGAGTRGFDQRSAEVLFGKETG